MMLEGAIDRRRFLEGSAAAGALGTLLVPAAASATEAPRGRHRRHTRSRLPRRGEFTIRGAHLLTMDADLGEIPGGDVHVRTGRIANVGRGLPSRGRELDGRRTIVMPGLIDTHWHMWTALHRSLASSSPENAYFALNLRLGAACRPVDIYNGVRLALAEAVSAGITTVR